MLTQRTQEIIDKDYPHYAVISEDLYKRIEDVYFKQARELHKQDIRTITVWLRTHNMKVVGIVDNVENTNTLFLVSYDSQAHITAFLLKIL